ncbi:MAG TPA: hypothetical protein VHD90_14910 [Phototrophicaceae bacterium]|nr:hypothetical protein [Phototrophicaceae bacterium]
MLEQTQSTTRSLPVIPIFARSIEFTTDLAPDAALDRLLALSGQPVTAAWLRANLTTERGSSDHGAYIFRVGVERHLGGAFTNAQFIGAVVREPQGGKTVVRGNFTATPSHMIGLLILLLLLVAGLVVAPFLIMIVLMTAIISTWEIYGDYRELETHIDDALR